jgi:DNA-directed RNA polymerase subunit E'/Rpb7|tara:strand:- start:1111 stop:1608 length:498 start_codon:yes stop_codon:yes gene_type:complete
MVDYISSQLLTTSINVEMKNIKGDINELLYTLLKKKYEGVCNKDGYIQIGSLQIINRSIGEVKTINNTSYIVYEITYQGNIYSPVKGTKLDIIVNSLTKMGIIGYLKDKDDDTIENSPFIVIVPREYFKDGSIDEYDTNSKLKVEIVDSRIKYMSKNIQVVAKPV